MVGENARVMQIPEVFSHYSAVSPIATPKDRLSTNSRQWSELLAVLAGASGIACVRRVNNLDLKRRLSSGSLDQLTTKPRGTRRMLSVLITRVTRRASSRNGRKFTSSAFFD